MGFLIFACLGVILLHPSGRGREYSNPRPGGGQSCIHQAVGENILTQAMLGAEKTTPQHCLGENILTHGLVEAEKKKKEKEVFFMIS